MMTLNDYNQSLLHLINNLPDEYNIPNNYIHYIVTGTTPEPKKSILAKFYENCCIKSETSCIACFNQVVEYCKE